MSDKGMDNYFKEVFIDDQHCDTCGLQIFQTGNNETDVPQIESKDSICLIKSQIAYLHEQILGCAEYDENAKPSVSLSIDNEFFTSKTFEELQKEHKALLKIFYDPAAYDMKALPNLKSTDMVNFVYIETAEKLHIMFDKLLKSKEIGVNLEYYSRRSYLGFSWLLQISTEDTYYMINCLKLQKELHRLNTIFMDNKIMKIFHDGENTVLRLYKDFGILVTNMFDTAILKSIIMESKKRDQLQKNICFESSQMHTHFLIFLKTYLVNFSNRVHAKFLKSMRQRCLNICKKVYKKSEWGKLHLTKLLSDKATNQDRYVATELLKWRDGIAQKENESPNFILPDNDFFKIVRELLFHRDSSTLSKCYGAKFLNNKDTYFNVREVVVSAQKISNKGKKFKTFLDYRYQHCFSTKSKSKDSKQNEKSSKKSEIDRAKKRNRPAKKTAKNLPASEIQTVSPVKDLDEESILKILKPQTCFKDVNDNDSSIWKPRLTTKPNALEPLHLHIEHQGLKSRYCHPYKTELDNFVVPRDQLSRQTPVEFKKLEDTPLHIVQTENELQSMLNDLKKYNEIAIDLKYNEERSYSGYTCLLLISTRDADYIIDALILRSELDILNEIFTDPTVLKVFHDSVKKMMWLQKDFSLYIVNMFDVARTIIGNHKKVVALPNLKRKYCKPLKLFKETGLSAAEKDWRVRPLSFKVKNHLRLSTHSLLYLKDVLSNELFFYTNQLKKFYEYCTDLCKNVYSKPFYQKKSYKNFLERKFVKEKYAGHTVRIRVMKELHKLRYDIAQKEDENPEFVMKDYTLLKLVDFLPDDEQKIADFWKYDKAKMYIPIVKTIISSARKTRKVSLKNDNDNEYIVESENLMKDKPTNERPVQNYKNFEKQNTHTTLADFLSKNEAIENGVMHLERNNNQIQVKERKSRYKLKDDACFIVVKGKHWKDNQTIEEWVMNWLNVPTKHWSGKFEAKLIKKNTWKVKLGSKVYKNHIWDKRYLIYYLEGTLVSRALTKAEQEIQKSLLNIGKDMAKNGFQVKIRDLGIKIEDKWYEWKPEGGLQEISEEEAWKKGIDVDL